MSAKTHFVISSEPLSFFGGAVIAICNLAVKEAQPEMMTELSARGLPTFNSLRDCGKCIRGVEQQYESAPKELIYLYAIRAGQEALDAIQEV